VTQSPLFVDQRQKKERSQEFLIEIESAASKKNSSFFGCWFVPPNYGVESHLARRLEAGYIELVETGAHQHRLVCLLPLPCRCEDMRGLPHLGRGLDQGRFGTGVCTTKKSLVRLLQQACSRKKLGSEPVSLGRTRRFRECDTAQVIDYGLDHRSSHTPPAAYPCCY